MPNKRRPNKGYKRGGLSEVNFLRKMKAIPLPQGSASMHGGVYQEGAIGKFLDRELLDGVCNPAPRLRNAYHAKVADISDIDLDALDLELDRLSKNDA